MTDQEIIKALECCANELGCEKCPAKPHRGNCGFCTAPLIKSAFDLITRKQAKIKELRGKLKSVRGAVELQLAEIEEFEKFEDKLKTEKADVMYFKQQIKSESVREFAEKLNDTFANLEFTATTPRRTVSVDELRSQVNWILHTVVPETICNLVKEMEGEDANDLQH